MRLGLLASGRGSNVAAILGAVHEGRLAAEPALLVCDRPGVPVLAIAERAGLPAVLLPRSAWPSGRAWDEALAEVLVAARIDLVALAGFASIIGPACLAAFPGRIVNIHPSLLPAFGGSLAPGPQAAALEAGVPVSGCTVHVVTAEVDAGPILAQAEVPVLPGDTVASLSERILAAEHRLYPEVLGWFAQGRPEGPGEGRAVDTAARKSAVMAG